MSTLDPTRWIKATASTESGTCVEMRQDGPAVEVRDTKDGGHGPTLRLAPAAFAAWIASAKGGSLDHLL